MIDERFMVNAMSPEGNVKIQGYYCKLYGMRNGIRRETHNIFCNDMFHEIDPATIEPVRVKPDKNEFFVFCPNCKRVFTTGIDIGCNNCMDCGMAIDWSL